MPVEIARPLCGHFTMTIPMFPSLEMILAVFCNKVPAGWIAPLVGAVTWGIAHLCLCVIEHGWACSLLGLIQPAGSLLNESSM
jgi:hypothetical protein